MAWGRILEVLIGNDPTDQTSVIDLSGLDIEGKVTRANVMTENKAELTIYNAKEDTRNRISTEGRVVIIRAGYEDEGAGLIFLGQVDHASSQKVGPDWITKVTAVCTRASDFSFGSTPVVFSYATDTRLSDIIVDCSAALGIGLLGETNASDIICEGGFVMAGTMREALSRIERMLKSHGCGLHMDLGELVVYKAGAGVSEFEGLYLSFDSGLLKAEPVEDNAKELRMQAKTKEQIEKSRKRVSDADKKVGTSALSANLKAAEAEKAAAKTKANADPTNVEARQALAAATRKVAEIKRDVTAEKSGKAAKRKQAATQTLLKQEQKLDEIKRNQAKATALLNHRARPNGIAQVDHHQVKGTWVIDQITFEFDNVGKNFQMQLELSA